MEWKRDLKQILIAVFAIFVIEVLLQKGPYSIIEIFVSTALTGFVGYFILTVIGRFLESKQKNKKNENT